MRAIILSLMLMGIWTCRLDGQDEQATANTESKEIVLFDGTSLDAWRGYADEKIGEGWSIVDGALRLKGSGGDLITKATFTDFDLSFEWRVTPGGNSGVMYRVTLGDKAPYMSGPEYQVLDDSSHADGKSPFTSAGSLYALYAPEGKSLQPVGEWNTARIVHRSDRVEHWLNGQKVVVAEIGSSNWKEKIAASKFKTWTKFAASPSGHLCLQDHGDEVWFRNIRLQPLTAVDGGQ